MNNHGIPFTLKEKEWYNSPIEGKWAIVLNQTVCDIVHPISLESYQTFVPRLDEWTHSDLFLSASHVASMRPTKVPSPFF